MPGSGTVRDGLTRAFRTLAILLVLLAATLWGAARSSGTTALANVAAPAGEVSSVDLPAPGQSVPNAGPNVPLLSIAPAAGLDLPPPEGRVLPADRTGEAGDRPGHRLRVERPPRPRA